MNMHAGPRSSGSKPTVTPNAAPESRAAKLGLLDEGLLIAAKVMRLVFTRPLNRVPGAKGARRVLC